MILIPVLFVSFIPCTLFDEFGSFCKSLSNWYIQMRIWWLSIVWDLNKIGTLSYFFWKIIGLRVNNRSSVKYTLVDVCKFVNLHVFIGLSILPRSFSFYRTDILIENIKNNCWRIVMISQVFWYFLFVSRWINLLCFFFDFCIFLK